MVDFVSMSRAELDAALVAAGKELRRRDNIARLAEAHDATRDALVEAAEAEGVKTYKASSLVPEEGFLPGQKISFAGTTYVNDSAGIVHVLPNQTLRPWVPVETEGEEA
nr:MAG TPA_asm: hypothetical protein [Caudoviricetes sp.]